MADRSGSVSPGGTVPFWSVGGTKGSAVAVGIGMLVIGVAVATGMLVVGLAIGIGAAVAVGIGMLVIGAAIAARSDGHLFVLIISKSH